MERLTKKLNKFRNKDEATGFSSAVVESVPEVELESGPPKKSKKKTKSKASKGVEIPTDLICLLRSDRYKNEEQLRESLTSLISSFSEWKKWNTVFLTLKDKGMLMDWIVDNEFKFLVYDKRKGEDEANRNYRLLRDSKAIVAFIPRSATGDKHWDYISEFLEIGKNLYVVYDEHGNLWDKKRRERPVTPYAQD